MQTWDTDKDYGLPIIKLRLNGSKYIEKSSSKTGAHKGIFIDVFPFDNVPNNKFLRTKHKVVTFLLKRLITSKLGYQFWGKRDYTKKVIYRNVELISRIFPLQFLKNLLTKEMTRYNQRKSNQLITFGGAHGYKRESINKDWVSNLKAITFEGEEFLAPKQYHAYLKNIYGDYMTPPPKNKRYNKHNIIKVDFGGYKFPIKKDGTEVKS